MTEPAWEMDAGADVATDLVQVEDLPFLGSLLPIRRNALGFFSRMLREHGDRVQLRVLGRKVILLCHPDDIEEVLVRDRNSFGRSAEIRKLRPIFGNGLLASDGAFHIQDLIGHMRDTMRDTPGGAWPHRRLENRERQRFPVDFQVIVNPQIELFAPVNVSFHEGCLSIPRLIARVERSRSVRVTCLDEHGDQRVIDVAGWYARILLHEIDHLNGRLYTDIMQPETLTTVENHQRSNAAPASAK